MPRLPEQLLNSLTTLEGFDTAAFTEAHRDERRITSIRLNPFKSAQPDVAIAGKIPWQTGGLYLAERPSFTHDPLFHAGCYYVQEPGSMFIEQALKQQLDLNDQLTVLDLCAAPGGKSTLINSLLSENSLLVANEIIRQRAEILAMNLGKWGTCNTLVTNNEPSRYSQLEEVFDAIVVDAPCSGSGLFRKQPEAIDEWSPASVIACALRQQTILSDVLPALKSGGLLVYSTCSYSTEENEAIVSWLCREHGMDYVPLSVPADWGIVETELGYRFYPHRTESEGFFCAVLRKRGNPHQSTHRRKKQASPSKTELELLGTFVDLADRLVLQKNGLYHLVNNAVIDFLNGFEKLLYFKKAGTVIGEIKGRDLVPHQDLAWSVYLHTNVPRTELDLQQALAYLRRQNFSIPSAVKGFCRMDYRGFGLGWAKILPNRINNYLPNELRVLS